MRREERIRMLMERTRDLATGARTVSLARLRTVLGHVADDELLTVAMARLVERGELVRVAPGRYVAPPVEIIK